MDRSIGDTAAARTASEVVQVHPTTGAPIAPASGADIAANGVLIGAVTETAPADDTASSGLNGRLQRVAQRLTTLIGHADGLEGYLDGLEGLLDGVEGLLTTMDADTSLLATQGAAPGTGTQSDVNDTASDATILASNANRKGACFFNESTSLLYLLLANDTASATNYSVQVGPGGYYELPSCQGGVYTGVVKGVWSADASGACRVTEFV